MSFELEHIGWVIVGILMAFPLMIVVIGLLWANKCEECEKKRQLEKRLLDLLG